jgi:hypothetical protein
MWIAIHIAVGTGKRWDFLADQDPIRYSNR